MALSSPFGHLPGAQKPVFRINTHRNCSQAPQITTKSPTILYLDPKHPQRNRAKSGKIGDLAYFYREVALKWRSRALSGTCQELKNPVFRLNTHRNCSQTPHITTKSPNILYLDPKHPQRNRAKSASTAYFYREVALKWRSRSLSGTSQELKKPVFRLNTHRNCSQTPHITTKSPNILYLDPKHQRNRAKSGKIGTSTAPETKSSEPRLRARKWEKLLKNARKHSKPSPMA